MLSQDVLHGYRSFIEYRLLKALTERIIEYRSDVTQSITDSLIDLGRHALFQVQVEKHYDVPEPGSLGLRSDVHWQGNPDHVWEIDWIIKEASAAKLKNACEQEKIWVLWAQNNGLLSLRLLDLEGINILILGNDIRKLMWERIAAENAQREGLHMILSKRERFSEARRLEAEMEGRKFPGQAGPPP
jgi:hypothetical protein